jgi:hypothetical protein
MIIDSLKRLGVSNAQETFLVKEGFRSACFNGVLDQKGDFKIGIADMEVLEVMPMEHLN